MLGRSGDSDVEYPAKLIKGLLESDIAEVVSEKLFQNPDIH